jgi:hypothetical protein
MKKQESKIVYRIIDRIINTPVGVYSRACHDDYDFESVEDARESNCHGTYKNKKIYKISKYKVTYELIEDDCK